MGITGWWSMALALWSQGGAPRVAWQPAVPLQGSLVVIGVRVPGPTAPTLQGELAGEPLHFELQDGWYRAIGGVPIGSTGHVIARIVIERAGGVRDTINRRIPVGPRRAPSEWLRTDPAFLQPPESLLPRIEAEQVLVRELKRRSHDGPRLWSGPFRRPSRGRLTSSFGTARIFNGRLHNRHLGVDLNGALGDTVWASNRGVVVYAGGLYYSGTTVFVDHGAGLLTAYLHLSAMLVKAGDSVTTGQPIGRIGASGRVTGPHLHWLASYGNIMVDPLDLPRLDFAAPFPSR